VRRLVRHAAAAPFATLIPLAAVPIGLLSIAIGPEVSRAYSIVFHQPELVYAWGAVLTLGGAYVAAGIMRRTPSYQRGGLYVLAFAFLFYGVSVMIGLGRGGLVTGPMFCTIAAACLLRARLILVKAKDLVQRGDTDITDS
jgi:hypothetical protein